MKLRHLVVREIRHRGGNFLFALTSVSVAVAALVGAIVLLQADDIKTEEILAAKRNEVEEHVKEEEENVEKAGKDLKDHMRRTMKGLGFNVLILPEGQDVSEFQLTGFPTATMPESYVDSLAESGIMTVRHLLPSVTKRIHWPEKDIDVVLVGTRGEVPLLHRDRKKPLLQAVPPGTMVVGYHIHKKLGLEVGDTVTFQGAEFEIKQVHSERNSQDDVTVWIDLNQAQQLLGMENLVNAILALECGCEEGQLAQIRKDIAAILPGTQVVERGPQALARAEARRKAQQDAEASLKRVREAGEQAIALEERSRKDLRERRESLAAILVPTVILACAVWIGVLTYTNVRQRTAEIGILRAIGLRSAQILGIFLGKAVLIGLAGAGIGYGLGFLLGLTMGDLPANAATASRLFNAETVAVALIVAPLLSALASWIPALLAANQDPAVVLQAD